MNGLVILNTYSEIVPVYGIAGTIMALCAIIAAACIVYYVSEDSNWYLLHSFLAIAFIAATIYCLTFSPKQTIVNAYMPDGVNLSEVTEKYDVLSVNGLLVTLIEKQN